MGMVTMATTTATTILEMVKVMEEAGKTLILKNINSDGEFDSSASHIIM